MKKILFSLLIILIVVILAGIIALNFYLGPAVKMGMETVGPKMTQVSVKVDAVNVSLLTGSAGIKNLVVGNPEGYKAPEAIRVGSAAIGVNPLSVLSDKIVIRSMRLEGPQITFEGSPFSGNNLNTILKNVNAATRSGGTAATNAPAQKSAKPAKKLEVDDLLITGAKVNFNGAVLTLPDIHLTNLGRGSGGITPADLTRRMLEAITAATIKAVVNAGTEVGNDVRKSVGVGVSNFSKSLGGLFKKITN
jgi:hypothetical protein